MSEEDNGTEERYKPVIGITIGDINGVGVEIIIKCLQDKSLLNWMTPVIYGSTSTLSYYRKTLNIDNFYYQPIRHEGEIKEGKINVINCWDGPVEINPGKVTQTGGESALKALEKSTESLKKGAIEGLVTAPINKKNIQSEEFDFPGHTEYLAERFGNPDHLMMMVTGAFRVGVATGHIAFKDVSSTLTRDLIINKINVMARSLKYDFGINKPVMAALGLNPHAGEEGLLGNEEEEVIKPALEYCRKEGHIIYGPFPADGFFGSNDYRKFDGIMAMYHDQGLVPFKALAFDTGVNFTAGLPIVRTSPDHGTAYSLAGKNKADESSFREAIYAAIDIIRNRKFLQEAKKDPLKHSAEELKQSEDPELSEEENKESN